MTWLAQHDHDLLFGRKPLDDERGMTPLALWRSDGSGAVDPSIAVIVAGEVAPADIGNITKHVVALCGGLELVTWLRTRPNLWNISVLGVRALAQEAISELAQSPLLAQIKRLVVIDHDSNVAPLLAACSAVEAVVVHRAQTDKRPMAYVAELLAAVRPQIVELSLRNMKVPIDVLASRFVDLETLTLHRCYVRGGELLGALHALRRFDASNAHITDDDIAALASCARLETLRVPDTDIGDAAAITIANAQLPALRVLDIGTTNIRRDGLVALESSKLALEQLRIAELPLDEELRVRFATSESAAARSALRGAAIDIMQWKPSPPPAEWYVPRISEDEEDPKRAYAFACKNGIWPPSPPGIIRLFAHERVVHCAVCGGRGWIANNYPCANHVESELQTDGLHSVPDLASIVAKVCATAKRITHVEELCVEIATDLHRRRLAKPLRRIAWYPRGLEWETRLPPPPLDAVIAELGPVEFADTFSWPYACEAAAQRMHVETTVFAAAAEMHDLGYWLESVDGDTAHVVMFPICAPLDEKRAHPWRTVRPK